MEIDEPARYTRRPIRHAQGLRRCRCPEGTEELGGSVGDIQFIKQGVPTVPFTGVNDPDSLAEMAKAAGEKCLR